MGWGDRRRGFDQGGWRGLGARGTAGRGEPGVYPARLPGRALQASPGVPRLGRLRAQRGRLPGMRKSRAAPGFRSPAPGRLAEPGLPRGCSHAHPGVPPRERGSRSPAETPRPPAQGVRRLTPRPGAGTHTPLRRGRRQGGGEYWFRYRGRAALRPRARAGAPTLTKHTCLGTGDKAGPEKCLGCGPTARPDVRRPRDTAPSQGQEGKRQARGGLPDPSADSGGEEAGPAQVPSESVRGDRRGRSGEILTSSGGGGPVIPNITYVCSGGRPGEGGWVSPRRQPRPARST